MVPLEIDRWCKNDTARRFRSGAVAWWCARGLPEKVYCKPYDLSSCSRSDPCCCVAAGVIDMGVEKDYVGVTALQYMDHLGIIVERQMLRFRKGVHDVNNNNDQTERPHRSHLLDDP